MARLTSLARVLESLDIPAEEPPAWADLEAQCRGAAHGSPDGEDPGETAASRPEQARRSEPAQTGTGPAGYEIWDSARRQADFYAAYAGWLEEHGTAPARKGGVAREWASAATLATAYRLASQHAALVSPSWSTRLAVRAAMAYVDAGSPFGLFLLAGLLDDRTLRDSTVIRDVVAPFRQPDASAVTRHPVQLTYLLLAAASRPWLRSPLSSVLSGARERLAVYALRPVGAQSVPLGDYLDLADLMLHDQMVGQRGPDSVRSVARRLAAMHRAQAATLRAAQRNSYLWRQGASPVNIIDLEHVALSGLALRHRPWFGQLSDAVTAEEARTR